MLLSKASLCANHSITLCSTLSQKSGTYTKIYDGQSGYLSQSRHPLYFGLGNESSVEKIEVTWPSGIKQTVEGPIEANTLITVTEK